MNKTNNLCPKCRLPYEGELYLGTMCRNCWIDNGKPKSLGELNIP